MRFGYDEHKRRIRPTFSGQKATCPLCNGNMIGKCGEIYVWHWQHHHDRNCDPWKEHETDWHRKWKAKFPNDWQEVIIENNDEKHIADIKTEDGVVIEFQNSSISTYTIRIRENFYQDMVWLINAETFKDHFQLRSLVNTQLRNIEQNAKYELSVIENSYKEELKSVSEKIEKNKHERLQKSNEISYKKEELKKLNQLLLRATK